MNRKLLVALLAISLVCALSGMAAAEVMGYSIKGAEKGFAEPTLPGTPSSATMAADALIGRPLGLGVTIAGTGLFIATLPMSLISGSTEDSAWGLVGRPAGWTFVRPFGRSEPKFEERGIFR